MSILIKNGTVVTSTQTLRVDVLISGESIVEIAPEINEKADTVIDAQGMYVLPGGIDPHVHLHLPTPAGCSIDNFKSGSIAALYGGTTTFIDFVTPSKSETLDEALTKRIAEATDSLTDYSFHVSPIKWDKTIEEQIVNCIERGFPSFKIYMAYKETVGLNDDELYHVMHDVASHGGMVTAHCELGDEVDKLRNQFFEEGKVTPKYHALSRPESAEVSAVKRAMAFADQTNCPLYIVHVSSGESVKHILQAQRSGQQVFAETCPQYLTLNDSVYNDNFAESGKYIISPPIRSANNNDLLWEGISNNVIQTVGTDHCPFSQAQKEFGINDFRKVPNGAGGIEHRLELLYTFGVKNNKISLNKLVNIFATQAAKIFGLYPQKGEIAVGSDADIVIWNPNAQRTISAKNHHSKADISIYEGFKVNGKAEYVLLRGNMTIKNGQLVNGLNPGKLLLRKNILSNPVNLNTSTYNDPLADNCGRV